jgi:hypothetical protein
MTSNKWEPARDANCWMRDHRQTELPDRQKVRQRGKMAIAAGADVPRSSRSESHRFASDPPSNFTIRLAADCRATPSISHSPASWRRQGCKPVLCATCDRSEPHPVPTNVPTAGCAWASRDAPACDHRSAALPRMEERGPGIDARQESASSATTREALRAAFRGTYPSQRPRRCGRQCLALPRLGQPPRGMTVGSPQSSCQKGPSSAENTAFLDQLWREKPDNGDGVRRGMRRRGWASTRVAEEATESHASASRH